MNPQQANDAAEEILSGQVWRSAHLTPNHPWVVLKGRIAAALLLAARAGWQPIESAPKSGRLIIAFAVVDTETGNWNQNIVSWNKYREVGMGESGWHGWPRYGAEPTHWLPLPDPPAITATND